MIFIHDNLIEHINIIRINIEFIMKFNVIWEIICGLFYRVI
jgi:hypothetical protein